MTPTMTWKFYGVHHCFCFFYSSGLPTYWARTLSLSYISSPWYMHFFPLFLWWVGVTCGIYKCFYNVSNISYLNPPPLPPPTPGSWSSFNRYHFCIYIHVYSFCTAFILLPPFLAISPRDDLPSYQPSSQRRPCSSLLFSDFIEQKREKIKRKTSFLLVWDKGNYTGSFLVIFPCVYVLQTQWVYLL
jgi:hypothetical protein